MYAIWDNIKGRWVKEDGRRLEFTEERNARRYLRFVYNNAPQFDVKGI